MCVCERARLAFKSIKKEIYLSVSCLGIVSDTILS